jgi:hypothetical protein
MTRLLTLVLNGSAKSKRPLTSVVLVLSGVNTQGNHNSNWLKCSLSRRIKDMDLQNWLNDVNNNSVCYNYKIFKINHSFEKYLCQLDYSNRIALTKFRCSNVKMPSNFNRFSTNNNDKVCNLCLDDNL